MHKNNNKVQKMKKIYFWDKTVQTSEVTLSVQLFDILI